MTPTTPAAPPHHPVPIAVAGLGKMGIMHSAMLKALPGARVAALIDLDANLGRHVSSMGLNASVYTSLDECLAQARPAGVVIATPQFVHKSMVLDCLRAGVAVFCEKPLAHHLDDAREMLHAAREFPDVPFAVGYQLAHHALFLQARALLDAGEIGQPKSFRAACRLSQVFSPKKGWTFTRERSGGGVLINSGCHLLYAINMLLGAPAAVTARGCGVHNEVEDSFAALLDYPSGLWGHLEVNWSVPGHELQTNDIEIVGTEGTLEVGNELIRLWRHRDSADHPAGWSLWRREQTPPNADFSLSPDYCGEEFYLQMQDFVAAIASQRAPRVTPVAAFDAQRVLDAAYRSLASGATESLAAADDESPAPDRPE